MKNNLKRALSLFLGLILCLSSFSALAISVFAEEGGTGLKKGEFTYAPHTYTEGDLTDYYYYSDDFFNGSATEYNPQLATMSMTVAAASISSQDQDATYEVKSRNLESLMIDLDFWGFEVNDYYKQEPKEQTMGVGMAYRVIGEGENAYTVLAIVPRSAGYKKEWAGNFTVGKEGLHEGFAKGKDIILEFAKDYVEYYLEDFEGEVKIWTMGYSRGAGVVNLLAADLVDRSQEAIGLELKKENIFAYTFGTPSTVEYANEEEKTAFAENYKNIWNVYADYDIVTFAPFRNWGFTYYGQTKNLDVYNADKKAKMLGFLKGTNETIYNIYTAENSSADPDNFMAVKASLTAEGTLTMLPAEESYGIPNNQKDFLESRIAFLVENLVPDRETYVDDGYQYALQQVTSLYFGLDSEGSTELVGGMTEKAMMLAGIYYLYFLTDCYLTEESVVTYLPIVQETLANLDAYLAQLAQPTPDSEEEISGIAMTEWYQAMTAMLASEEFMTIKGIILTSDPETLKNYVPTIKTTIEQAAIDITTEVLGDGVLALTMDDEAEKEALYETMTDEAVAGPLAKFIVYLLLGSDNATPFEALDIQNIVGNKNIALAATFVANAGRYMRVHNNEIILSWLRAEDTNYLDQTHVHVFETFSNDTHHGVACSCETVQEQSEHTFGEWTETKAPTTTEEGFKSRSCACGYTQYEMIPKIEESNLNVLIIVVASVAGAVVIAGGVTAFVLVRKRKK